MSFGSTRLRARPAHGTGGQLGGPVRAVGNGIWTTTKDQDWDRASCLHLTRRSVEVLPAGGSISLHEMLLADTKDGPLPAQSFSLAILAGTHGEQFTLGELTDLLGEAGFTDVSLHHILPLLALHRL